MVYKVLSQRNDHIWNNGHYSAETTTIQLVSQEFTPKIDIQTTTAIHYLSYCLIYNRVIHCKEHRTKRAMNSW